MVGRLVEHQHVRLGEQHLAQRHAAALAARELRRVRVPRRQPQRVGGDLELAVQVPGAGRVDPVLQLALFLQQLVEVRVRVGEGLADLVETVDQRLGLGHAFLDIAAHVLAVVELRLLRQVADAQPRLRPGFALELLVHAGHDPQQGGLARAVVAEHADLGAGEEVEVDVLENLLLRGHDLGQAAHREHVLRHGVSSKSGVGRRRIIGKWFGRVQRTGDKCRGTPKATNAPKTPEGRIVGAA